MERAITCLSGITRWSPTVQIGSSPTTSGPWLLVSFLVSGPTPAGHPSVRHRWIRVPDRHRVINPYIQSDSMNAKLRRRTPRILPSASGVDGLYPRRRIQQLFPVQDLGQWLRVQPQSQRSVHSYRSGMNRRRELCWPALVHSTRFFKWPANRKHLDIW